jgi:Phosphoesterase family
MGEAPGGRRLRRAGVIAAVAILGTGLGLVARVTAVGASTTNLTPKNAAAFRTRSPIKHVVVLFDENVSFDHYFGTYPNAANTDGTPFHAATHTPKVNGLTSSLPNGNPNAFNPQRLSPSEALTCDQDHGYGHEQLAYDQGKMDRFVEFTGRATCTGQPVLFGEPGLVMDYYDGNTVTALWNYAQRYAMSDNSYDTVFGPSTPGAVNLISGQTHGVHAVDPRTLDPVSDAFVVQSPDSGGVGTVVNDPDPAFDDCSDNNHTSTNNLGVMTGPNIGDLLNRQNVTWGWFQGGFRPTGTQNGFAVCGARHQNVGGRRRAGPLRLRPADPAAAHLPVQQGELRRPPRHRPDLHHQVHRGQLAHGPDRRHLLRRQGGHAGQHARLRQAAHQRRAPRPQRPGRDARLIVSPASRRPRALAPTDQRPRAFRSGRGRTRQERAVGEVATCPSTSGRPPDDLGGDDHDARSGRGSRPDANRYITARLRLGRHASAMAITSAWLGMWSSP